MQMDAALATACAAWGQSHISWRRARPNVLVGPRPPPRPGRDGAAARRTKLVAPSDKAAFSSIARKGVLHYADEFTVGAARFKLDCHERPWRNLFETYQATECKTGSA